MDNTERVRGTTDIPMNALGISQVRASAANLVRLGGLDSMYHSNLGRARKVADIVTERMPAVVPVSYGDALLPWDLGNFQGKPVEEVAQRITSYVYHPDMKVPGGESFNDFKNRFLPVFRGLMRQGQRTRVGVAAHGRTDALATAYVLAGMPEDNSIVVAAMFQKVPTGSVLYIAPDFAMGRINGDSTFKNQPGVFMIRHGATNWNGVGADRVVNAMTS